MLYGVVTIVSMLTQMLWAGFLHYGKARGSRLKPKRVAHVHSKGLSPIYLIMNFLNHK
jgi:hypothetical protein